MNEMAKPGGRRAEMAGEECVMRLPRGEAAEKEEKRKKAPEEAWN